MKKSKTLIQAIVVIATTVLAFACNSNTKPAEETKAAAETPVVPDQPKESPEFDLIEISHSVKNYTTWRPFFNNDATNRKAAGLEDMMVGQSIDNPNDVVIYLKSADLEKAKQFTMNPLLKEVMEKAGVTGKPNISSYQVIRHNQYTKESQWVAVTHRVKDFDTWIKAYDGEGKEKRVSQGMIDVVLARGAADPNMVLIVFNVTDLEKAKAAIFSEEKKQLMVSAGVEGKPMIQFYTAAK